MPKTLRLPDRGYMRRLDVENILRRLYALQCVELIGMSNVGKSALLQLLADRDVWSQELGEAGRDFFPVYVDCNRMLSLNEQGFCELVLRCLQECSPQLAASDELVAAYNTVVAPSSDFQVPLSFSRGLAAALKQSERKIVLLLDEFDDPYVHVDARVFLNLRAVQDRHSSQLAFVTATGRPLSVLHSESRHGEFAELFSNRSWYLAPLTRSDTDLQVRRFAEAYEAEFSPDDMAFIYQWSGGHPRMAEGICQLLAAANEEDGPAQAEGPARWQFHGQMALRLQSDPYLNDECCKIWNECSAEEQAELAALEIAGHQPDAAVVAELLRRYVLVNVEGRPQLFARLLAAYVQRISLPPQPLNASLWLDAASSAVTVNGQEVEGLTALEYKLLLLLFQNRERLMDKYQIVTSVWGESYIDEVDDARVEKLISRLRQKIEPDPANPQFLTTVRGRGYKLAVGE